MMFYPMARAKCARSLPYSKKWSNRICEVTHMARGARGSARAPKIISDLNFPSKIDAF